MPASPRVGLDSYVLDTLMPDLVGHDRKASAFLVYLYLWRRGGGHSRRVPASLQRIADDTGLSRSAVQQAVLRLRRRHLVRVDRTSATAVPEYTVLRPWAR
jgi:DNA-binding MarR family transcriptional regulator